MQIFPLLSHYGRFEDFQLDSNRVYVTKSMDCKPNGLWVSVDSEYGWVEWWSDPLQSDMSEEEEKVFRHTMLKQKNDVILKTNANILVLDTAEKIDQFHKDYKRAGKGGTPDDISCIKWPTVTRQYDGILISPHQRDMHFKYRWYNIWGIQN